MYICNMALGFFNQPLILGKAVCDMSAMSMSPVLYGMVCLSCLSDQIIQIMDILILIL